MTDYQAEDDVLRAMLAKADEKLEAARQELSAGLWGDAASRAYYATFHALSAVLASKGMTFSTHSQVIGTFNREFVKTGLFPSDTARKIQRLFEDRQTADYDWQVTVDEATAQEDLAAAESLVVACRSHLGLASGPTET